ncbi:MAG: AraC family transcriptional regulator [Acidovorax sp.]|uniref:helix-turn-helix domain-containing protein n=1 Tax=Acidovorax sp. TaxID=1872122 RepID=UPI0039E5C927
MPAPRIAEPLLFGDSQSETSTSLRVFSDRMAQVFPGLEAYDALPGADGFFSKHARLQLPGLELVASAMTPTRVSRSDSVPATMLIPLQGHCHVQVDGRTLHWGPGQGCLYLAEDCGPTVGYGETRNQLMLRLDTDMLQAAARAVLGTCEEAAPLAIGHAQVLPMQVGSAPLDGIARHLGALIDLHGSDSQVLHQLGLQDFIYRHLVSLFSMGARPFPQPRLIPAHKRRAIDRVCDTALADLSRPHTLTAMAAQAHMSVRALQYAFQERFGLSPMDWLRQQRLARAHQRLRRGDFTSITLLAQECGLGTASRFAALYRQQFGQSPSVVAGRRRGR